jgi:hypothetical protein
MHNIVQIHKIVLWDWQYFTKYSPHWDWMWEIFSIIPWNIVSPIEHSYGSE